MWILPKQLHTLACALDTEALSLDLNESSQLCEQSLFVRSKPLPARTWLQKWKRDSWTAHLFGRILKPSLGQSFVTAWTSCLEATPASHSQAQESGSGKTTQDIYGHGSQMEFDLCDQESVSSRMLKDTSVSDSEMLSKNWQALVTRRRGEYSQRVNAVRLTNAKECSSWPTSSARDWKGCYKTLERKDGKLRGDLLPDAVNIEETHGQAAQDNTNTHGNRQESWETATVSTGGYRQKDGSITPKLDQQVKAWATPQARDHRTGEESRWENPKKTRNLNDQTAGKLNPRWVETLMGLPIGWTMPSCTSPVTIEQTNCDSWEMA